MAEFGQLTVLRGHTGCVERGTEHHASDQPSVREGANGIEQWDARHGHAAHHTEINATGARPNRSTRPPPTHAPMMVAMTLLAAVAPAQAALFV